MAKREIYAERKLNRKKCIINVLFAFHFFAAASATQKIVGHLFETEKR